MGTLRFFEEVVSFKIRRTFGFADYKKIPDREAGDFLFRKTSSVACCTVVIVRSLCDRSEVLFPDFVNDVNMVVGQGVQTAFGFGERGGEVDVGDFESGTAQPVGVVAAVDAPVVVLAENAGSLSRIGDRVVFEGFFARKIHRRQDDAPAAGFQDAVEFAQRLPVVFDMFQDVIADHHVRKIVLEGNVLHVEMHIGQRTFEVGGEVQARVPVVMFAQFAHQADFGSDVQDAGVRGRQVGFALQVEP